MSGTQRTGSTPRQEMKADDSTASQDATEGIAVIGLGCRYPGAEHAAALWQNVLARRQQFRRMPDGRLPLADYHDPDRKVADKTYSSRAALIDGFLFDWVKRRVPKQTVEATDIAHWLALEVAIQALEDAGYVAQASGAAETGRQLPQARTAVVLGNSLTGEQFRASIMRLRWPYIERELRRAATALGWQSGPMDALLTRAEGHFKAGLAPFTEDTLAGFLSNTIAGRVCNFLDVHGGGYVVDGACASSLLAVATACDALSRGDVDVALAGGVDVSIDPFELVGFAKAGALTPGDMHVYDKRAQGFIPGEGSGVLVLKRLSDARRDGDYVYATLRGWGISSDGKGGITAPSSAGQSLALERAYRRAGYAPQSLTFIEGHGTGT
ncbi:MAG: polyketide synthase, partial [Polyangiales bacterium]